MRPPGEHDQPTISAACQARQGARLGRRAQARRVPQRAAGAHLGARHPVIEAAARRARAAARRPGSRGPQRHVHRRGRRRASPLASAAGALRVLVGRRPHHTNGLADAIAGGAPERRSAPAAGARRARRRAASSSATSWSWPARGGRRRARDAHVTQRDPPHAAVAEPQQDVVGREVGHPAVHQRRHGQRRALPGAVLEQPLRAERRVVEAGELADAGDEPVDARHRARRRPATRPPARRAARPSARSRPPRQRVDPGRSIG